MVGSPFFLGVFFLGVVEAAAAALALPPPENTPAVLTRVLILMACSAQMPILSMITGLLERGSVQNGGKIGDLGVIL